MDTYTVFDILTSVWPEFHIKGACSYFDRLSRKAPQTWIRSNQFPSNVLIEMICKHQGSRVVMIKIEGQSFPYLVPNPV